MSVLTKTTGRQATNHSFLRFCFGLALLCLIIEALIMLTALTSTKPDFDSYNFNYFPGSAAIIFSMASFLKRGLRAGHVFLEARYKVWRFIFIGIGVFLIGLGFLNVIKFFELPILQNLTIHFNRPSFFGIYSGSLLIFMGYSRIQFCEKGVLNSFQLIPWDTIEWYEWIKNNDKTCKLNLKFKGDLFGRSKIEIPVETKENAEALFQVHSVFLHDPDD